MSILSLKCAMNPVYPLVFPGDTFLIQLYHWNSCSVDILISKNLHWLTSDNDYFTIIGTIWCLYITWTLNNGKQTITTCWTTPYHHEIIDTWTGAPYQISPWFWPLWPPNIILDLFSQCYNLQTFISKRAWDLLELVRLPRTS